MVTGSLVLLYCRILEKGLKHIEGYTAPYWMNRLMSTVKIAILQYYFIYSTLIENTLKPKLNEKFEGQCLDDRLEWRMMTAFVWRLVQNKTWKTPDVILSFKKIKVVLI